MMQREDQQRLIPEEILKKQGLKKTEEGLLEAEKPTIGGAFLELGENYLEAAKNVPKSAANLFLSIGEAIINPVQTAKSLKGLAFGAVQKLIPGEQPDEKFVDDLAEFYKERYGSLNNVLETFKNDPVGMAADLAAIFTGTGVAARGTAAATRVAKVTDAAAKVGKVADVAIDVGRAIEPTTALTTATGQAFKALTPTIKSTKQAEKAMARAIDINPSDSSAISSPGSAGISPEKWLLERGISGSTEQIISKLEEAATASKNYVDSQLALTDKTFNVPRAKDALNTVLEKVDTAVGLENETVRIRQLINKDELSLSELNEVKRTLDEYETIFKTDGQVGSAVKAKGLAKVRNQIKNTIEKEAANLGIPDIKDANKQTQVSRQILNAIKKSEPRIKKRQQISLSDLGIAGAASFITPSVPGIIGVVIAKKIYNSTKFQSELAKRLSKIPKKELIGLEKQLSSNKLTPAAKKQLSKIYKDAANVIRFQEQVSEE